MLPHLSIFSLRSTKNFMKKYNLRLTAATFIILDTNEASMEVSIDKNKNCCCFFWKILVIIVRYYGWVVYIGANCTDYFVLSAMTVTSVCCFFKECFCLDCLRVAEMYRQHNQPSQPSSMQLTRKSAKIIKNGGQQYQLTSQHQSKMAADKISWFSQISTWKIISVVLPDLFSLCNQSI